MRSISRTISIWVILAMAATLPGAQAFAFSSTPMSMAGCHGHHHHSDPAAPAHGQYQYQCCANGHHWAIPVTFAARPLLALVDWNVEDGSTSALLSCSPESTLLNPAVSPPAASPLRI